MQSTAGEITRRRPGQTRRKSEREGAGGKVLKRHLLAHVDVSYSSKAMTIRMTWFGKTKAVVDLPPRHCCQEQKGEMIMRPRETRHSGAEIPVSLTLFSFLAVRSHIVVRHNNSSYDPFRPYVPLGVVADTLSAKAPQHEGPAGLIIPSCPRLWKGYCQAVSRRSHQCF